MPCSLRVGFCARHGIVGVALICASVVACNGADSGQGRPASPPASGAVADDPPTGFATLVLTPASPLPASANPATPPAGTVWYRVGTEESSPDPAFEWYVRVHGLQPRLAFRVELTVDDHASYSVGSAHADDNGVLTAHGALARFADQFCVGDPAPPQSISGTHIVAVSVKSDGSGAGTAGRGGPLTDPTQALPCGGNGDNVFEYWLITGDPIQIGDSAAAAAHSAPAHGR